MAQKPVLRVEVGEASFDAAAPFEVAAAFAFFVAASTASATAGFDAVGGGGGGGGGCCPPLPPPPPAREDGWFGLGPLTSMSSTEGSKPSTFILISTAARGRCMDNIWSTVC
jgi:hypothetical protein